MQSSWSRCRIPSTIIFKLKPGFLDFTGRAKYKAWEEVKDMTKDLCMKKYIQKVNELEGKYPITLDSKSLDYVYKRLDAQ